VEGQDPPSRIIFESAAIGPFYLSWTPDGQGVSFLANDEGSLSLRLAAADGSSSLDGSGPGAIIRKGSPLYFDWIDPDHLYAHIGNGSEAFLGEMDRAGQPVGSAIDGPGPFRSVDVSEDGTYVAYVRAGVGGRHEIVVAHRDGSSEQAMPVFDIGAVDFSPTADVVASIGSIEPVTESAGYPIGPLRLIDAASGKVRTLLDDAVLGFSWSPDGSTIAAIRFVQVPVEGAAVSTAPDASAPATRTEIRLTFVDVASGDIRSNPEVRPSPSYVNAILAYFDQYSLSHQLWAPDSSSLLLPIFGDDGDEHIAAFDPDGGEPVVFDGVLAFWTPPD
jgi:Tol biopolymer transport system component